MDAMVEDGEEYEKSSTRATVTDRRFNRITDRDRNGHSEPEMVVVNLQVYDFSV